MKKLLSLLLTILMLFILVGCNSNQEEDKPTIEEQPQIQEDIQEEIAEEEVIVEEPKEEIKMVSQNIANMYFWVTTFDQYGNELDRYTAKYGSTVYDPSGKTVIVKGNLRFYITENYSTTSNENGSEDNPIPTPPPDPSEINYFYIKNYGASDSCFEFRTSGPVSLYENLEFQCSNDKINWTDVALDTDIEVSAGETLYLKAKTTNDYFYCYPESGYQGGVSITDYYISENNETDIEVGGSIMTLMDPTDRLRNISNKPGCFCNLFWGFKNLKKADNLIFPATKLSYCCYRSAFEFCENIKSVNPDLLSATNLTGADDCYYYMFKNCTVLENAPKLPATTLSEYCYYRMFYNCDGLENAPFLPATQLKKGCYSGMFFYCPSLNSVEVKFNSFDGLPEYATEQWLSVVGQNGTFKWPGPTSGVTRDGHHIPSTWNIIN